VKIIGQVECPNCGWRGNHVTISYDGTTFDPEGLAYHQGQLKGHTERCEEVSR